MFLGRIVDAGVFGADVLGLDGAVGGADFDDHGVVEGHRVGCPALVHDPDVDEPLPDDFLVQERVPSMGGGPRLAVRADVGQPGDNLAVGDDQRTFLEGVGLVFGKGDELSPSAHGGDNGLVPPVGVSHEVPTMRPGGHSAVWRRQSVVAGEILRRENVRHHGQAGGDADRNLTRPRPARAGGEQGGRAGRSRPGGRRGDGGGRLGRDTSICGRRFGSRLGRGGGLGVGFLSLSPRTTADAGDSAGDGEEEGSDNNV